MAATLRWATMWIVFSICTACASPSSVRLEYRDYRKAAYRAEFLDYRARCRQQGKRIWISARSKIGRDGIPKPGDRYYCA